MRIYYFPELEISRYLFLSSELSYIIITIIANNYQLLALAMFGYFYVSLWLKLIGLEIRIPALESWPYYLLIVWSWAGCLTFWSLNFLVFKMGEWIDRTSFKWLVWELNEVVLLIIIVINSSWHWTFSSYQTDTIHTHLIVIIPTLCMRKVSLRDWSDFPNHLNLCQLHIAGNLTACGLHI